MTGMRDTAELLEVSRPAVREEIMSKMTPLERAALESEFELMTAEMAGLAPTKNGRTYDPKKSRKLKMTQASDVTISPISWLWKNRIALNGVSLLVGDPGLGKSQLSLAIAAHVTTGKPFPDGSVPPVGTVMLMSAEDEMKTIVVPRLMAAGADLSRVVILGEVMMRSPGRETQEFEFNLQEFLPELEEALVENPETKLLIIDPITAYLGASDSHNNAETRGVLKPLAKLAERNGIAILGVSHLNKASSMKAIHRTMGSLAFVAAPRATFAVVKDGDDSNSNRRYFTPIKNNLGDDKTGFEFFIGEALSGVPFTTWGQPTDINVDEFLSGIDSRGKRDEAAEILLEKLTAGDGKYRAAEIEAEVEAAGISMRTLKRAKKELGIYSKREGFSGAGHWYYCLPDKERQTGTHTVAPYGQDHE